jgi:hypothetical protein
MATSIYSRFVIQNSQEYVTHWPFTPMRVSQSWPILESQLIPARINQGSRAEIAPPLRERQTA